MFRLPAMNNSKVIDVDKLKLEEPEIEFQGFYRRLTFKKSDGTSNLETDGIQYTGFATAARSHSLKQPQKILEKPSDLPKKVVTISLLSDDEDSEGGGPSTNAQAAGPALQACAGTKGQGGAKPSPHPVPLSSKHELPSKELDKPSAKRLKLRDGKHAAAPPAPIPNPRKRQHQATGPGPSEVIIIDSDDEGPPPKRACLSPVDGFSDGLELDPCLARNTEVSECMAIDREETDSDSEYSHCHAALNLNEKTNWMPLPDSTAIYADAKEDQALAMNMAMMSISVSSTRSSRKQRGQVVSRTLLSAVCDAHDDPKTYIWNDLQLRHRNWKPRNMLRSRYDYLRPADTIMKTSGAVNKMRQCGGIIAIASAADGGVADTDCEPYLSPYNSDGNLKIWYNGQEHTINGHDTTFTADGQYRRKFYTVNDVDFDPLCPTRLVSCGLDRTVKIWDCEPLQEDRPPELVQSVVYKCNPDLMQFKPEGSVLAIAGSDGCVYLQRKTNPKKTTLPVATKAEMGVVDLVWGAQCSADKLFVCSAGDSNIAHKAFDSTKGKEIFQFDTTDSGERLAIDDAGERLAFTTFGPSLTHELRIYDARRCNPRAVQVMRMDRFRGGFNEVNRVSFSPDGLYLAVARSDNIVSVYDSRLLGRGALQEFAHDGLSTKEPARYGVVEVQWLERERQLITGGNDGCVRVWDPMKAQSDPYNGRIIAECAYDVAHFAVGKDQRDKPLVVGDLSGRVTIYDYGRPM